MTLASLLDVDARSYFHLGTPNRIAPTLRIALSEHCFVPSLDDLDADWLASVATPAFHILARTRPAGQRRSFLSIGTGCGLDALGAIEILESETITVTDVFADIVAINRANITANVAAGVAIALRAETGDLLGPLTGSGLCFDTVYENLPNTPIDETARLADKQTAAGFLAPRIEASPAFVQQRLLVLHYLALQQARPMLNPGGAVFVHHRRPHPPDKLHRPCRGRLRRAAADLWLEEAGKPGGLRAPDTWRWSGTVSVLFTSTGQPICVTPLRGWTPSRPASRRSTSREPWR
jgi:hypothetical protein